MREGRNRQIRRTAGPVGFPVLEPAASGDRDLTLEICPRPFGGNLSGKEWLDHRLTPLAFPPLPWPPPGRIPHSHGPLGRWLRRAQPWRRRRQNPTRTLALTVSDAAAASEARGLRLPPIGQRDPDQLTPVLEASGAGLAGATAGNGLPSARMPAPCWTATWPCRQVPWPKTPLRNQAPPVHDGWDSSRQPSSARFRRAPIDVLQPPGRVVLYALNQSSVFSTGEHPQATACGGQPTEPCGRLVRTLPRACRTAPLQAMTSCSRPIRTAAACGWPNGAWRCNGCGVGRSGNGPMPSAGVRGAQLPNDQESTKQ